MPAPLTAAATAARRRRVLRAATRVFARRGFHQATMRDVAREAGVADGTLYSVFAGKHELLLGLLDPLGEATTMTTAPSAAAAGPAAADLTALLQRRLATLSPEALAMVRVVLAEALVDPTVRSAFAARVLSPAVAGAELALSHLAAAAGIPAAAAPLDPALAARTLTATVVGLVVLRLLGDPVLEARAAELPERVAPLLVRAFGSHPEDPSHGR